MSAESAALLALERRIRAQLHAQVRAVLVNFGAYLAAVVRGGDHTSAGELFAREDVNAALTAVLAGAEQAVERVVRGGYQAGAQLGRVATGRELRSLGHGVSREMPDLGGYLDSVLADVRSAFGVALFDIRADVTAAHDGVSGPDVVAHRVLTTNAALKRATGRLGVRLGAAGGVAPHRGFSDAQLAYYRGYAAVNPFISLRKRWTVTNSDPCEHCAALDGVVVRLGEQFEADPVGVRRRLPVYRDLLGPPRHPNCRCRLELVAG